MAESKEELKSLLMKVKEGSEKVDLKPNIQKTKIMASSPIISWHIYGGKVETMTDFIFPGSKITSDGDCSHEIKRGLLLGRKPMRYLDSILKKKKKMQRHLFADKGPSSQSCGFSSSHVWMRELDYKEGWVTSLLPSLSVFVMTIVTDVKRLPHCDFAFVWWYLMLSTFHIVFGHWYVLFRGLSI